MAETRVSLPTIQSIEWILRNPPANVPSAWEREKGRGIVQYSFGEYRLSIYTNCSKKKSKIEQSSSSNNKDEIIISEDCSFISTRVWDCSVFTVKWMEHIMTQKCCTLTEALKLQNRPQHPPQVLELGAGTGLLSIFLAKHGAAVLSTEYGSALKYLQENCDSNHVTMTARCQEYDDSVMTMLMPGIVTCRELDWYSTRETLQSLLPNTDIRANFDLIVVTDCSLTAKESRGVLDMIERYSTPGYTRVVAGVCNQREGTPYFTKGARKRFDDVRCIPTSEHHPEYQSIRHSIFYISV